MRMLQRLAAIAIGLLQCRLRTLHIGKLAPGAYLLEARAGGIAARDLVLVSGATLVLKTSGQEALVYFADALDGSPIALGRPLPEPGIPAERPKGVSLATASASS